MVRTREMKGREDRAKEMARKCRESLSIPQPPAVETRHENRKLIKYITITSDQLDEWRDRLRDMREYVDNIERSHQHELDELTSLINPDDLKRYRMRAMNE